MQVKDFIPLSHSAISTFLSRSRLGQNLHILEITHSTNSFVRELGEKGMPHGTVVLAESQTAGRGRLSRTWFSPPHTNLYCSILLSNLPSIDRISWIPLMTAVGMAQTVQYLLGLRPSLKWPNDILIRNQKIGGVLCESFQPSGRSQVIVGFGLNVNMKKEDLPPELQGSATSLAIEMQQVYDRNTLLGEILLTLDRQLQDLQSRPLTEIQDSYRTWCSTLGRSVQVNTPSGYLEGQVFDIGQDGSLQLLITENRSDIKKGKPKIIPLRSGDIINIR